jgi:hypothetical protein
VFLFFSAIDYLVNCVLGGLSESLYYGFQDNCVSWCIGWQRSQGGESLYMEVRKISTLPSLNLLSRYNVIIQEEKNNESFRQKK